MCIVAVSLSICEAVPHFSGTFVTFTLLSYYTQTYTSLSAAFLKPSSSTLPLFSTALTGLVGGAKANGGLDLQQNESIQSSAASSNAYRFVAEANNTFQKSLVTPCLDQSWLVGASFGLLQQVQQRGKNSHRCASHKKLQIHQNFELKTSK